MQAVTISINGEQKLVEGSTTLPAILTVYGIDVETTRGVAVAVNDEIVRRKDWIVRRVESGDRIEIVTARQGG